MKAQEALKKAFNLPKGAELKSVMPAKHIDNVLKAMRDYADSKAREQRVICQYDFEQAVEDENMQDNLTGTLWYLYNDKGIQYSGAPNLD